VLTINKHPPSQFTMESSYPHKQPSTTTTTFRRSCRLRRVFFFGVLTILCCRSFFILHSISTVDRQTKVSLDGPSISTMREREEKDNLTTEIMTKWDEYTNTSRKDMHANVSIASTLESTVATTKKWTLVPGCLFMLDL